MDASPQCSTTTEFWRLYRSINMEWNRSADLRDLEPYLLDLLCFIKAHPESEGYFKDCFIFLMTRSEGFVFEAVEFCMREMRWPEVHDAACELIHHFSDWRKKHVLLGIAQVYQPIWDDADLYEYYAPAENS